MERVELALEDDLLVRRLLAGEQAAFELIAEKYFCTLYSICFAHVRERETAEELAQEVLLRVYLNMSSLKNRRTLAAWAGRIARNLSKDWLRRGQTRSRLLPLVSMESLGRETADPSLPTPRDIAADAQQHGLVDNALAQLSPELREVVLLHYTEGLSKSEIARRLDIFPSSVGRRLERALETLKVELEPSLRQRAPALKPTPAAVARVLVMAAAVSHLSAPAKAALLAAGAGTFAGGAASSAFMAKLMSPITVGGVTVTKLNLAAVVIAIGTLVGVAVSTSSRPQPVRAITRAHSTTPTAQIARSPRGYTDSQQARAPRRSPAAGVEARLTTDVAVVQSPPETTIAPETSVTLRLFVQDWSTRYPVDGAEVRISSIIQPGPEKKPVVTTVKPGEFVIEPLQPDDQLRLVVSAPKYMPLTIGPFAVPSGTRQFEKTCRIAQAGGLSGRLVEPRTKNPVADVKVGVRTGNEPKWIVTGADGKFTLRDVKSGTVSVMFSPKDTYPALTREFTTVQGRIVDVGDIELTRKASSIRGRIIRMPGEMPVPKVRVQLTRRQDAGFKANSITDDTGNFSFEDLPNATYIVELIEPRVFQQVSLGIEEERELVLRIGGVKLRGHVTMDGKPVTGDVHLSQGATGYLKEMVTTTDSDGWFELEGVSSGWWLGDIYGKSPKGRWNNWFEVAEKEAFEYEFVIPFGKATGKVFDSTGRALAGARVFIVKNDAGAFDVIKPPDVKVTKSNADGSFVLPAGRGRLFIRASKDGMGQSPPVEIDVPDTGEAAPVQLRLQATQTGSIRSTALDYADGKPLKNATLNLYDESSRLEANARRDEDGIMTLNGIVPGKYRVVVSSAGYSVDERNIEVKADEIFSLDSVLYESGALCVVVQDAKGEFLPNMAVNLIPEDETGIELPRSGITSRGGLVMVRGLMPGGYTVKLQAPGGGVTEQRKIHISPRLITDCLIVMR